MAQRSHRSHSSRTHSSAPRTSAKADSSAPLHTLSEDEVVRKIHRKVGGPSKLSTYDDPAKVRAVVIQALAQEQATAADAHRVHKGDLTTFERRVVRTVTNRGAAVRSRMRQRKELQRLRDELRAKDQHVRALEQRVEALTRSRDTASMQQLPPDAMHYTMMGGGQVMPQVMPSGESSYVTMPNSMTASSSASSSTHDDRQWTQSSVDREQFGKWIDQMIS